MQSLNDSFGECVLRQLDSKQKCLYRDECFSRKKVTVFLFQSENEGQKLHLLFQSVIKTHMEHLKYHNCTLQILTVRIRNTQLNYTK